MTAAPRPRVDYKLDLTDIIAFPDSAHTPVFPPSPNEQWIILREVVQSVTWIRPVYETIDVHGTRMKIAFYCDDSQQGAGILVGQTIAIKNGMLHHFMDGSVGYRIEDFSNIQVLNTNLVGLTRINTELESSSKADKLKDCSSLNCSKLGTKKCSGCKITRYCSSECQTKHWTLKHRSECNTVKNLVEWSKVDMS